MVRVRPKSALSHRGLARLLTGQAARPSGEQQACTTIPNDLTGSHQAEKHGGRRASSREGLCVPLTYRCVNKPPPNVVA